MDFGFIGTPSVTNFDALIFGYYEETSSHTPLEPARVYAATRTQLYHSFQALEIPDCPFSNLPEQQGGRSGQGLTAENDVGMPLA